MVINTNVTYVITENSNFLTVNTVSNSLKVNEEQMAKLAVRKLHLSMNFMAKCQENFLSHSCVTVRQVKSIHVTYGTFVQVGKLVLLCIFFSEIELFCHK